MGCCPSKCPGVTLRKKYAATTTEPAVGNAVQHMLMDRGDGAPMDKSDEEERKLPQGNAAALDVRVPEETTVAAPSPAPSPPRKSSRSADDIPISSTYHRMLSAVVAEQEVKRQEELQLQAEQREREVRDYKAAMQQRV